MVTDWLATDWLAQRTQTTRLYFITMFITGTNQASLITDKFVLLQSGNVFYKGAKLTGALYTHRVLFTLDGSHSVISQILNGLQSPTF